MSENAGSIIYTVEADTKKLLDGATRADTSLDSLQKSFDKTDKAADKTQFQLTKTAGAAKQLAAEAQLAQTPLGGLTKLLAGLATIQGAMSLVEMAEQYGEMAERVQMATSSTAEYEMVQARLLDTANNTYRSMREAQEIYIQTSDTLRSMGYSTEQALDVVDSLSYSFVKNATSTERANSAMSAFTGAMMTGKLAADGWKTIIAAVPSIIDDIAKASGRTASEVRALGATGAIVSTELSEGLRNALEANKAAADGMATTVKDAFTQLKNNLSMYVGEANLANGATGLLSKSIMLFGQNLDVVVNLLLVAGAGALAKYITQTGMAAIASATAALEARKQAAAELQKAQALVASTAAAAAHAAAMVGLGGATATATAAAIAHAAAQRALTAAQATSSAAGVGLTAILGGPVGIVALLASAATAAVLFGSNAAASAVDVDKLTDSVEKLTVAQIENRLGQAGDAITILGDDARKSQAQVDGLKKDYEFLNAERERGLQISDKEMANVKRAITEQEAETDAKIASLQKAYDKERELQDALAKRTGPKNNTFTPTVTADPEAAKRLQGMREELELAKLTGEARAKLAAIQKLGDKATPAQREEAERLGVQIYKATEAQKALNSARKDGVKGAVGYLDNLVSQVQRAEKLTFSEQLRYDIASGRVKLQGVELEQAQGLAATADAIVKREKDKAIAIQLQNAQFEAQQQILSRQQQYDMELGTFGMGDTEAGEIRQRMALVQEYSNKVAQLRNDQANAIAAATKESDIANISEQYAARIAIVENSLGRELEIYENATARKKELEKDWLSGAMSGVKTYAEQTANSYKTMKGFAEKTLGGITDAFTNMVMTNKIDFAGLARSVLADLVRMAVQGAVTRAAMSFFPGLGFSAGGVVPGFASGGYTGAGGKNTPAGIVHAGEVVFSQKDVARNGGVQAVESLRKQGVPNRAAPAQYVGGGGVEVKTAAPVTINSNLYVTESGTRQTASGGGSTSGKALNDAFNLAMGDWVTKQQRPGGLLWNRK